MQPCQPAFLDQPQSVFEHLFRLGRKAGDEIRAEHDVGAETARLFADVQREIRTIVPAEEVGFIAENIGSPEPINLAWVESGVIGSFDGEILVQLADEHAPTALYERPANAFVARFIGENNRLPGTIAELDEEDGMMIYEVELATPDGRLIEVEIDAASGRILALDEDDED